MPYILLLLINIIPNLYAEKNLTVFQVSTIVVNSCENFVDDDYVSFNYDTTGNLDNSFLDNIKIRCTKDTNYNLEIDDSEQVSISNDIINNISEQNNNYSEDTSISDDNTISDTLSGTSESLVELNSKVRYLRQVAKKKSTDKSFYEVVNVTISF